MYQFTAKMSFCTNRCEDRILKQSSGGKSLTDVTSTVPENPPRRCKVMKASYCLKQARFTYFKRPCTDLKALLFVGLKNASCVFVKRTEGTTVIVYLWVYVGSMVVIAPNITERQTVVKALRNLYEVHIEDVMDFLFRVRIEWLKNNGPSTVSSLKLSHPAYSKSVPRRLGMKNSK